MTPTELDPGTPAKPQSRSRQWRPQQPGRLRRFLKDWVGTLAVCLLIGAALTIIMATRSGATLPTFVVLSMISLCFAGAYITLYRLLIGPMLASCRSNAGRLALHLLGITAATAIGGEVAMQIVQLLLGKAVPAMRPRVFGVGLAVLAAIQLLLLGYERLRQRVREVELREERARQQALKAELAALRARTDPHFLFNSLNTIAGLIEEQPQRAVEVVTRLAGFFRHSLRAGRSETVTLGEEIRAAGAYLEIQALRFSDRLTWRVEVDPGLEGCPVPTLMLQPLVENAVVHGAAEQGRPTTIVVSATQKAGRLRITVDDNGPGPGGSGHRGAGTTLVDLAERLNLLYANRAALATGRSPMGGFRVDVQLPATKLEPLQQTRPA